MREGFVKEGFAVSVLKQGRLRWEGGGWKRSTFGKAKGGRGRRVVLNAK